MPIPVIFFVFVSIEPNMFKPIKIDTVNGYVNSIQKKYSQVTNILNNNHKLNSMQAFIFITLVN